MDCNQGQDKLLQMATLESQREMWVHHLKWYLVEIDDTCPNEIRKPSPAVYRNLIIPVTQLLMKLEGCSETITEWFAIVATRQRVDMKKRRGPNSQESPQAYKECWYEAGGTYFLSLVSSSADEHLSRRTFGEPNGLRNVANSIPVQTERLPNIHAKQQSNQSSLSGLLLNSGGWGKFQGIIKNVRSVSGTIKKPSNTFRGSSEWLGFILW